MAASLLFLDIDGVLNSIQYYKRLDLQRRTNPEFIADANWSMRYRMIDPLACEKLIHVIRETNCEIVISSTWRKSHDFIKDFRDNKMPEEIIEAIIGSTGEYWNLPHFKQELKAKQKDERETWYRGFEIASWLLAYGEKRGVTNFAIVDDDGDMWTLKPNWIHTRNSVGLQDHTAQKLIDMLNKDSSKLINRIPDFMDVGTAVDPDECPTCGYSPYCLCDQQ